MGLPDYLPYIQFFGQIALIAAATFAGYQILQHRKEKEDQASLDILTRIQTADFREAYTRVWDLPLQCPPETIRSDPEISQAVETVAMTFESMGVMVFNRLVPIETVDQILGGFLRESWRRVEPFVQWKRQQLEAPRWAEWYQWLAERVEVRGRRRSKGAYEAFRTWKE